MLNPAANRVALPDDDTLVDLYDDEQRLYCLGGRNQPGYIDYLGDEVVPGKTAVFFMGQDVVAQITSGGRPDSRLILRPR
jgi:hypothetical protein